MVPILTTTLRISAAKNEEGLSKDMLGPCQRVLRAIVPIALPKTRLETVLECFWACFDAASGAKDKDSLVGLVKLSTEGFKTAFSNATNKGKIYTSFVDVHFASFARAVLSMPESSGHREMIWDAARDVLCSFEAIKAVSQQQDSSSQGFFGSLLSTSTSLPAVLGLCPKFFLDQINAAKLHRLALSQANADLPSWQSYKSFAVTLEKSHTKESIAALAEILKVVAKHIAGSARERAWLDVLNTTTTQSLQRLISQEARDIDEQLNLIGSLVTLGRINYELLEPHIATLFEILACVPSDNNAGQELYEVIVSYYAKTRNMEHLVQVLFSSILQLLSGGLPRKNSALIPSTVSTEGSLRILGSCLLSSEAGITLSTALIQYATPGQVPRIINATLLALKESWTLLRDCLATDSSPISPQVRSTINRLSLALQQSSSILPQVSSLLARHSEHSQLVQWRETIWGDLVTPCLKITLDASYAHNCEIQLLCTLSLRLVSSLEGSPFASEGHQLIERIGINSAEILLTREQKVLGELKLELARVLLRSSNREIRTTAIQCILDHLSISEGEDWNGSFLSITANALNTAFSVLLADRWLKLLQSDATNDQLQQFSAIIVLSHQWDAPKANQKIISYRSISRSILRNGVFWESDRSYGALLSIILKKTEAIEPFDRNWHDQLDSKQPTPATIEQLGLHFHLLLFFPPDVLKGGSAATLSRRAILIDWAASHSATRSTYASLATRTTCRLFASRFASESKSSFSDYMGNKKAVEFLLAPEPGIEDCPELVGTFVHATNTLLDMAFSSLSRRAVDWEATIGDLLTIFRTLNAAFLRYVEPSYLDGLARLFHDLAIWHESVDLSSDEEVSIRNIVIHLQDELQGFLLNSATERPVLLSCLLRFLRTCLRFRYVDSEERKQMADKYTKAALLTLQSLPKSQNTLQGPFQETMWIVVDVLELASGDHEAAAKMISVHCLASSQYGVNLDTPLQHGAKKLDPHTYEWCLKLLTEALRVDTSKHVVHALSVLLTHSPEGTFKTSQAAFSESLSGLNNAAITRNVDDIDLQRETLNYALCLCIDKPVFIRTADMGNLLSLLAGFLQPSTHIGAQTYPDIFHSIVKVAMALIRNRRDLIVLNLPHLAVVFCLLLNSLTNPLENLGQRQYRSISCRLPSWISLSQPLGGEEAALLSRLLVGLTTKTAIRGMGTAFAPYETGKDVQSLAKPFGKHASCVVAAYIGLLNDPLCHIDRETRAELTPGLFALCGMLGEKGRDALMPILDNGGKAIFKTLWSSYESQKYVGQG